MWLYTVLLDMFRATKSGYQEFKFDLIRRVVKSLVETPNPVSPDRLHIERLESVIGRDLSELYWPRIPESHYYFIASVAADEEFYVPKNADFDQPAEDVIEQIAFAAIVEDVQTEFSKPGGEDGTEWTHLERTRFVLKLHQRLDTLVDEEVFPTPSAAVDDFYTWVADREETVSLSGFSEQQIRRQEPINVKHDNVISAVDDWTADRLP